MGMILSDRDIYEELTSELAGKQVAIWGIDAESTDIYTYAINAGINIAYFVDSLDKYVGISIFGKKTIQKEQVVELEDVYLIISPQEFEVNKMWLEKYAGDKCYIFKPDTIRQEIKNSSSLYIYGAGGAGKITFRILQKQGIQVTGFVDSDRSKVGKMLCGLPIYDKSVIEQNGVIIISSMYYPKIYESIAGSVNTENVYIDYRTSVKAENRPAIKIRSHENGLPIVYMLEEVEGLHAAIWNDVCKRRIVLYGINFITKQVIKILKMMGLEIDCIVDDMDEEFVYEGYQVKNIYDLAYGDIDDLFVIVVKLAVNYNGYSTSLLLDSGESLKMLGLKRFLNYRPLNGMVYAAIGATPDLLLTYRSIYDHSSKKVPGFTCWKKADKSCRKIVVLGGSAADPGLYEHAIKNWTEYLDEKYKDIAIYSGAIGGYTVGQECLKLLRDVSILEPELIISYSGVNDGMNVLTGKNPFTRLNQGRRIVNGTCVGLENDSRPSEKWLIIERYMKAIAEVNGSKFISVLQPALSMKMENDVTDEERLITAVCGERSYGMVNYPVFVKEIREQMKKYDWMYDLSDVFNGVKETVYRDNCHLNDYGNKIIANRMYEIINDYYAKMEKRE